MGDEKLDCVLCGSSSTSRSGRGGRSMGWVGVEGWKGGEVYNYPVGVFELGRKSFS